MTKYKALLAWDRSMHSEGYWCENNQTKAEALNAPLDTVYFDGNTPVRLTDVVSQETKDDINRRIAQMIEDEARRHG